MRSHWKIWIEAATEEKARRVFDRVRVAIDREAMDLQIEPYSKIGGFVVSFGIGLEGATRNDAVIELIELGQRVGSGWILCGRILDDPEGWSNEPSVSGVRSIQWRFEER